jgi:hypothetical protein
MTTHLSQSIVARHPGLALRLLGALALATTGVAVAPSLPGGGTAHADICTSILLRNADGEAGDLVQDCHATAPPRFAAVAVSGTTLNSGSSWGFGSLAEAQNRAMIECGKRAGDCKIAGWAQDGCVALAISPVDKAWASDWSPYYDIAEARALGECRRNNGQACAVATHPCSGD